DTTPLLSVSNYLGGHGNIIHDFRAGGKRSGRYFALFVKNAKNLSEKNHIFKEWVEFRAF
ncbi:MAG: hypothetical protein IJJ60_12595, partial [Clostridia bacterium]|nr:hypothetical protein [Clostridia bacterium]